MRKVTVLYIGGYVRSGSTLLERMLGNVRGFVAVGEILYIWQTGVLENRLCSCGSPFRECDFWNRVAREAFGGWDNVDYREAVRVQRIMMNRWLLPYAMMPKLSGKYATLLREHTDRLGKLYQAIRDVSGAEVVIDSSKDPFYALLLRRVPGVNLRIVHIVRDSRGVAFSRMKRVVRPEVSDRMALMRTTGSVRTGIGWSAHNLIINLLGRSHPYLFVRYEDLVTEPSLWLDRILDNVVGSVASESLAFIGAGEVALRPVHTVAGNPMRFSQGVLPLRVDEEWKIKMDSRQRHTVSLLTWPLLLRYGYFTRGGVTLMECRRSGRRDSPQKGP